MPGTRRGRVALAVLTVLVAVAACSSSPRPSRPSESTDPHRSPPPSIAPLAPLVRQKVLDADGRLGADLLDMVAPAGHNAVLSPYSIAVALQMALVGARGATATQLARTLHQPGVSVDALIAQAAALRQEVTALDDPGHDVAVRVANSAWPQAGYPIKAPFTQSLQTGFGVGVRPVDFGGDPPGARRAINQAVSHETSGKIPELFPDDLDPLTRLVLTNAVYLKARWATPFEATATRPGPFHLGRRDVQVPFLNGSGAYGYARRSGYELVSLPYRDSHLAMTLIVPDGPLAAVENTLRERGLAALLGGPLPSSEVTLTLPKFRFRTHVELNDPLRRLGLRDALDPDRADFSGITDAERLFVSQVVHEAYISVDEQGTEAAAATGVVIQASSGAAQSVTVTVDHPFLFAITDQTTGTPLFLGRVADPSQG